MALYKDIDLSFTKNEQSSIDIITDVKCINQSLKNIIFPKKGAYNKFQKSTIGTNIEKLLGEKISGFIAIQLNDEIETVITNFEQRIKLLDVKTTTSSRNNSYTLEIYYEIKRTYETETLVLELEVIL